MEFHLCLLWRCVKLFGLPKERPILDHHAKAHILDFMKSGRFQVKSGRFHGWNPGEIRQISKDQLPGMVSPMFGITVHMYWLRNGDKSKMLKSTIHLHDRNNKNSTASPTEYLMKLFYQDSGQGVEEAACLQMEHKTETKINNIVSNV